MSLSEMLKNPNLFYTLSYNVTARVEDHVKYSSFITRFFVKQVLMFPVYVILFVLGVLHEIFVGYLRFLDKIGNIIFRRGKKMKKTESIEIENTYCDICGKITNRPVKCKGCGKDICSNCRWQSSLYCEECWYKDEIIAEIETTVEDHESGYEARTYTIRRLVKDNWKWNDLLVRFEGKKVKIIFEEVEE